MKFETYISSNKPAAEMDRIYDALDNMLIDEKFDEVNLSQRNNQKRNEKTNERKQT